MIDRAWDSEQAEHTIYEPCPECFALVPFSQILYQSKDVRAYGGPFGTIEIQIPEDEIDNVIAALEAVR